MQNPQPHVGGSGGGVNLSPYIGAKIDLAYDSFGVNSATLTGPGFKDGGIHTFSATLDPIVHLNPHGHVDFYVLGGGGIYHHYWDFSGQPWQESKEPARRFLVALRGWPSSTVRIDPNSDLLNSG